MRDPHYMTRCVLSSCAIFPDLFLSLKNLMLDPLRLFDVTNHTDKNQTKGLYINR